MTDYPRLHWRRMSDGAFAACPNGEAVKDQLATIAFTDAGHLPAGALRWIWSVRWEGRFHKGGSAFTKQVAADQATAAWWDEVDSTAVSFKAWEHGLRFIDEIERSGSVQLPLIDLENAAYDDLMRIMRECTRRWDAARRASERRAAYEEVIARLSEEFRRRRSANRET